MEYRAKRSAVMDTLKAELKKGFIEKVVEVSNHKFTLRTLPEDLEVWADGYMRSNTPMSIYTSRKAPRLAASIQAIDGVKAAELFPFPDEMPDAMKKELNDSVVQKRYWLLDQMMYFLSEDTSRPFIDGLYAEFDKLEGERNEAIKGVGPLSTGTPAGP